MVHSELDSDKGNFARITGGNSGRVGSVFGREPSFSRWCDEDEEVHLNRELGNARNDLVDEDPGFDPISFFSIQVVITSIDTLCVLSRIITWCWSQIQTGVVMSWRD
ncbi:hypothetical protein S245_048318 [Arachis hypogaea]|nr:uncharacterized protein DS421_14g463750 [Arachis hypogaea]